MPRWIRPMSRDYAPRRGKQDSALYRQRMLRNDRTRNRTAQTMKKSGINKEETAHDRNR